MLSTVIRRIVTISPIALVLASGPAFARFGKSGGGSGTGASSTRGSSHASAPVGSSPSSSSGYRGGSYRDSGSGFSARRYGFSSGAFVPWYGYSASRFGYGYRYASAPRLMQSTGTPGEPSSLRVSVGLEATAYLGAERGGFGVGGTAAVEGERWGIALAFHNIAAPSADGISTYDTIQQFNAHATFAFLTGRFGRLRIEAGADTFFAANLTALAPTAGLSGIVGLGGAVALEGSIMVTPWPIRQLDFRGGAVVGLGPVGLRAGLRAQVLDDQGVVDGVVKRDLFWGPYAGASIAF